MNSRQILNWIWQPRPESPVNYMGPQCVSWMHNDLHGFRGIDTEGIPWQIFFDNRTRTALIGFSGEGISDDSSGSTQI